MNQFTEDKGASVYVKIAIQDFMNDGHLYTSYIDKYLPEDFANDLFGGIGACKFENTTLRNQVDVLRNSLKELLEAIKYHHADDYVQIKYGRVVMGAYKALEQTEDK